MKEKQTITAGITGLDIGLITCTSEKKAHACQARELYSVSPNFVRQVVVCLLHPIGG